jgi:hypothetical protein
MEITHISGDVLMSLKQTPTPLNTLFFSEYNQSLLQRAIRQVVFKKYAIKIDYQDKADLIALMRTIYTANFANPYGDLCSQVKFMNTLVIEKAVEQISTGLSQYMSYMKHITSPISPPPVPENTSVYGSEAINQSRSIGL